jgi:hypothetical protein
MQALSESPQGYFILAFLRGKTPPLFYYSEGKKERWV